MHDLPADWSALCAIVFLLGLKHGFDADHLATIDALTRVNARHGERHARWCGALFALGHGAAVVGMVAALAAAGALWPVPEWLGPLGGGISIALLTALGIANLRAVFAAAPGEVVVPRSLKGRLFARLFGRARRPLAVALVGSLFAVSFDTVSQAGLFALGGTASGGLGHAVALVSLLVAGLGVGKWASASVDDWAEGKKMVFGAAVIAIVAARGLLAHWLARRDGAAARLSACASSSAPAPGS